MSTWDEPSPTLTGDAVHRPAGADVDGPVLGRGGEGLVVAGRDRNLPREVAWKVVPADDLRGVARLENEAALLAALEHPAIVPVYDLVRDATSVRLALKQIRGQTLAAALPGFTSAAARMRVLPHVLAACHAVAWAHHCGVLHRDLKSANVMIGAFGETQVIDWGIACAMNAPTPGTIVGTPQNMSPEQARGEAVDPRSDVWGLGTILVELITGRPLFDGTDARATMDDLAHGRIPRWTAPPAVPRALCAIAERATAAHAEDRYPDAAALADDIAAFLEGRVVAAHRYSAWETFRRFVGTFRVAIAIALTLVATGTIAALLAYDRITDERDGAIAASAAANAALVEAGLANAQRELNDDFRAEAELAAAQVLAIRDAPEARGIVAAFARAPRPVRTQSWALPASPPRCRDADLSADGTQLLCGDGDHLLTRIDLPSGRRETIWSAPYSNARFAGTRVAISRPERSMTLVASDGARHFPSCGGLLVAWSGALVEMRDGCVTHLAADPTSTLSTPDLPCAPNIVVQSATPLAEGYAVLCPDGRLIVRDPTLRVVQTSLVSPVSNYRAMAPLGDDTLVIGVSDGELIVIDHRSGDILRRAFVRPRRLIRAVATHPASHTILAEIDGLGGLLVHDESLAPFARLPRDQRTTWLYPGATDLVAATHEADEQPLYLTSLAQDLRSLSRWRLPLDGSPTIHLQEGRVGITSLSLEAQDWLGITWSEHAELADARSGKTLEHVAWPNTPSGIAKALARDGPGAWVAVSAPSLPRTVTSDAGPLVGLGAFRRIFPLPSPEPGLPRFVAADNGRRLHVIDQTDDVIFHPDRMPEVAALGALVGALSDPPRRVHVFDLAAAPLELTSCPAPDALTIALLADGSSPTRRGPLVLLGDAAGVSAYDLECNRVADFRSRGEPTVLGAIPMPAPTFALVAAGTREGGVEIWDIAGRLLATIDAHTFPVRALDFAPDASTLASGAWDGRLRFYDVPTLLATRQSLVIDIERAWRLAPRSN